MSRSTLFKKTAASLLLSAGLAGISTRAQSNPQSCDGISASKAMNTFAANFNTWGGFFASTQNHDGAVANLNALISVVNSAETYFQGCGNSVTQQDWGQPMVSTPGELNALVIGPAAAKFGVWATRLAVDAQIERDNIYSPGAGTPDYLLIKQVANELESVRANLNQWSKYSYQLGIPAP